MFESEKFVHPHETRDGPLPVLPREITNYLPKSQLSSVSALPWGSLSSPVVCTHLVTEEHRESPSGHSLDREESKRGRINEQAFFLFELSSNKITCARILNPFSVASFGLCINAFFNHQSMPWLWLRYEQRLSASAWQSEVSKLFSAQRISQLFRWCVNAAKFPQRHCNELFKALKRAAVICHGNVKATQLFEGFIVLSTCCNESNREGTLL